ncbi:MAG: hypothetical protein ACFFCH_10880 [Promethearchaeota archaeon]
MGEQSYRIRIKTDSLEIEVEGDQEFVEKKFGEIWELLNTSTELPSDLGEVYAKGKTLASPEETLVEFYKKVKPKSNPERVLVFAYYLKMSEEKKIIGVGDITKAYESAYETKSKNPSKDIARCVKHGWLAKSKEKIKGKPAYYVTQSGESWIKKALSKQSDKK